MARRVGWWLSVALPCVLAACGSGGAGSDVPFTPDVPQDGVVGDTAPDTPKAPTKVDEAFRVVFPYAQYAPSSTVQVEWLDPAQREADPKTSFDTLLAALDPALSCQQGCIPDRSGKWLAVVVSLPTSGTSDSTVRLFRLFDGPVLGSSSIPDVVGVRTFAFGTDAFVFTRMQYGCYESDTQKRGCAKFFRIDLSVPNPAGEESLFTFPTEELVNTLIPPSGAFRIGQDGRTVIVLGPTITSQSAWLWRGPTGLPVQAVGPICAGTAPDGGCLSAGFGFLDTDPVALSPDGNHLVMALVERDQSLILTHVDLRDGTGSRKTASLLTMPEATTSFATNACYNRLIPGNEWRPTFVYPPLRFSPDGTEVVFVAGTSCQPNNARPWTNVLAIPLARIDAEGVIARGDLRWITDFPTGDTLAACVSISRNSMDLSPTGDYVVFAGSPMLDSSFQVIPDGQSQLGRDDEVWVTRRDGTTAPVQLTGRQSWKATSTTAIAVPPAAP